MPIYDKNKYLGISGITLPNARCTQMCYDFDSIPNIIGPIEGHKYYLHSSVRSNLCYSDKQWVLTKTIQHITSLLMTTVTIPSRVVVHYGKKGTCSNGLERIIGSLSNITIPSNSILDRPLLLENAAGQGTEIGTSIEEMRYVLENSDKSHQIGTCLDTCHAYSYGYNVQDPLVLEQLIEAIETYNPIKLIHLNDSKGILGCKIDRHENIGRGHIWSYDTNSLELLFSICSEKLIDIILETPDPIQDFYNLEPFLHLKRRKKYY